MHLPRLVLLASAHFALVVCTALVAYGWDLDHLSSRSALSVAAASVLDALVLPYQATIGHARGSPLSMPLGWLVANSVLWGVALYGLWFLVGIFIAKRAGPGGNAA
jgi:hypothetical protein